MRCSGNVMASRDLVPTCGSGCDSSKTNHEDLKSPPRAKRLIHCAGVALRSRQYGPDGGSVSEVRPIGPSELVRPFWGLESTAWDGQCTQGQAANESPQTMPIPMPERHAPNKSS
eukprot:scaffold101668_cov37-Tisochrysis_lutea.AAC.2